MHPTIAAQLPFEFCSRVGGVPEVGGFAPPPLLDQRAVMLHDLPGSFHALRVDRPTWLNERLRCWRRRWRDRRRWPLGCRPRLSRLRSIRRSGLLVGFGTAGEQQHAHQHWRDVFHSTSLAEPRLWWFVRFASL